MDGQGTECRRNIAENVNHLSRVHERYRQTDRQTDGRQHIANVNVSSRSLKTPPARKAMQSVRNWSRYIDRATNSQRSNKKTIKKDQSPQKESYILGTMWQGHKDAIFLPNAYLWTHYSLPEYTILFWELSSFLKMRVRLRQDLTRMWANAQRDGRPAEHGWRPLFNAAKFGSRSLLDCCAV